MFPSDDHNWVKVAELIQSNLKDNDRIIAPFDFQEILNNCIDCLSVDMESESEWVILHKGWIERIDNSLIKRVIKEMNPVHANSVFVVFTTHQHVPVATKGNVHLIALIEQIYPQGIRADCKKDPTVSQPQKVGYLSSLLQTYSQIFSKISSLGNKRSGSFPSVEMPSNIIMAICHSEDNPEIPTLEHPVSQLCTASQFYSPMYQQWADEIAEQPKLHRKQWEFVYILSVLNYYKKLNKGVTGLGFGCGKEPIASVMANHGCKILLSDLDVNDASQKGWVSTNQHAHQLRDLYKEGVCDWQVFTENTSFMSIDMNHIPENLPKFDFIWSSCALEHLGSLRHGIDFILNSSDYLKPGGIAVHTTEYNLSSNDLTIETKNVSIYRRRDIEELVAELSSKNLHVSPVNFFCGDRVEDGFIDIPPYTSDIHLKLLLSTIVTTSIGIVIQKPA